MYEKGISVPGNDAEAAVWYRKAAEHGHGIAQYNLAGMYEKGRSVPQDDATAYAWADLAAAQGDTEAAELRDSVAQRMTPDQVAEAQQLSRELLERIKDKDC